MTHVFISYAKIDTYDLALYLHDMLNNADGFTAWMDETLVPGKSWARSIEAEIDRADFMIVLLSPDVNRSEEAGRPRSFVLNEIDYAQQIGKPIIPVMAQRTRQPIQIAGIQYIDLTVNKEAGLQRLMRRLGIPVISSKPITASITAPMDLPKEREVTRRLSPIWIGAIVALSLFIVVGISLLNGIDASNEQPTPTTEDASTPDLTRTMEVLVAQFIETNAAAETQAAATLTANFTPSATPNTTQTAESMNTSAAIIAAEQISTQKAQLTANAPTNTPEPPTLTATFTPTLSDDAFTATAIVFTETAEAVFAQTQQAVQIAAETAAAGTLAAQSTASYIATETAAVQTFTPSAESVSDEGFDSITCRVNANRSLNIRALPNTGSSIVGGAQEGASFTVIGRTGDNSWWLVSTGWVFAQLTTPYDPACTTVPIVPLLTQNADWTPVRQIFGDVEMVQVPQGCFRMGENGNGGYQCFKAPFWMGETEVTNTQYAEFIDAGGYDDARYWTEAGWEWKTENQVIGPKEYRGFTNHNQPRVGITWYEAVAYTNWLTEYLRSSRSIPQNSIIRLPTESEWEYAARGPDGLTYPWRDVQSEVPVNVRDNDDNYSDFTAPVGSYPKGASWVGALDMSGNVWEWILSGYDNYPYNNMDGRNNISGNISRMLRGGSFTNNLRLATTTHRSYLNPDNANNYYGFRIVLVSAE